MNKKRCLLIKDSFSNDAYLYERFGSGPQKFIAKLNDLETIAKKIDLTKAQAFELLLELIRKRAEKTKKPDIKERMELILFDPYLYFGIDGI